ncbi:MAG: hypothetical protein AAF081_15720 [Actinomycetota bacterium]
MGDPVGPDAAGWAQDDRAAVARPPSTRTRVRTMARRRLARIAWWLERRPATEHALRQGRLVTVARTALAPRLAGARTRLRPGSVDAVGRDGLGRAIGAVARRPVDTPFAFPQDTDGEIEVLDTLPGGAGFSPREVRRLRRRGVVRVEAPLTAESSGSLLQLARAGVVLTAPTSAPSSPLGAVLDATVDPCDHRARELQSIRVRRAAWAEEVGTTTQVSVLLATRRPDELPGAVDQVARQHGCDVQLCVGLHGPHWDADTEERIGERFEGPSVIERFGDDVDLGTMLDRLARRAEGRVVVKWDDDDLYGDEHLLDLVLAHHYSGAELVGKAAEFVHLGGSDITIRRFAIGAERPSTTLAGGTLLVERTHLHELGGWPPGPKRVDALLIAAVLEAGGTCYRTHGFQFILRRRRDDADGHTWSAPDDYFLRDAVDQAPGLALDLADIGHR